jgi:hypothetical protein
MASTAEFYPACREISRYSPKSVQRKDLATKGMCHLLRHRASILDSRIQTARNANDDSSSFGECPASPLRAPGRALRYPARDSRGVSNRLIAEPANGSKMGTASNPICESNSHWYSSCLYNVHILNRTPNIIMISAQHATTVRFYLFLSLFVHALLDISRCALIVSY